MPREDTSNLANLLDLNMDDEFSDFISSSSSFMPSTLLNNPDSIQNQQDHSADLDNCLHRNNKQEEKSSNDIVGNFLQSISKSNNLSASQTDSHDRKPQKDGKSTKDLSGWYQLFAELDPLSNPDAIPSKTDTLSNSLAA